MTIDPAPETLDAPERFAELVVEAAEGSPDVARRRVMFYFGVVAVAGALVAAWWLTPLRHWVDIDHLTRLIRRFSESPFAPLFTIALFVIGGLLVVPVNALTAVTILVFGPLVGSVYALSGSVLSALVIYELTRAIPIQTLRKRIGARLDAVRGHLSRHGILAVALVRLVPIAPYSIVNAVLGVLRVKRTDYLLGTILGMLPGIVASALLIDRIVAAIRSPSPLSVALLAIALCAVVALTIFVRLRLKKKSSA